MNRTGKGQFGVDKDPSEMGKRGQKAGLKRKTVAKKILKQLRDFQNLPFKDYQRLKREGKIPDDATEMLNVLLAGEEGFDYLMAKKVSLMEHLTKEEIETNKVFKEKIAALKESGYFAKSMRESIYGTKSRNEVKLEDKSKIDKLFEDLSKETKGE